jgi:exopolyphosphatase / guanosine-5'-triphosphate,3'-diphosphate pyrophosphatase
MTREPVFAAIDIGANSVRLKVARLSRGRLVTISEDREVTRLGETVFRRGSLSSDAMGHTIEVLRRFHRTVQAAGAEHVRVVATSALRDAENAQTFVDWAGSATGWHVEVISGLEEGRLIHLAIMSGLRLAQHSRVLMFDLGGGSCEVTISDSGEIEHMVSMPLGAVRLTREFLQHDPPKAVELERASAFVAEEVNRLLPNLTASNIQLTIATSGTAAALSEVWATRQGGHPATVPRTAVSQLRDELAALPASARAKYRGIGTRRAEIIVAGAIVFSEILTRLKLPSFRYSSLGLRDGLLAQMAADYDRGTAFQRRIEAERRTALIAMGERYGVDLRFAERVRDTALELYDALSSVHRLPAEYRDWLTAAAMLHEVGMYVNRTGRHRHSYYLISHSELFGYSAEQRIIIGAIARYIGKSKPSSESRPVRVLANQDQTNVRKSVVLLRLARALNQSRRALVKDVSVYARGNTVRLNLTLARGGAELELWALEKERTYFRDVFGRELLIAAS